MAEVIEDNISIRQFITHRFNYIIVKPDKVERDNINYQLDKLNRAMENMGGQMMDRLEQRIIQAARSLNDG